VGVCRVDRQVGESWSVVPLSLCLLLPLGREIDNVLYHIYHTASNGFTIIPHHPLNYKRDIVLRPIRILSYLTFFLLVFWYGEAIFEKKHRPTMGLRKRHAVAKPTNIRTLHCKWAFLCITVGLFRFRLTLFLEKGVHNGPQNFTHCVWYFACPSIGTHILRNSGLHSARSLRKKLWAITRDLVECLEPIGRRPLQLYLFNWFQRAFLLAGYFCSTRDSPTILQFLALLGSGVPPPVYRHKLKWCWRCSFYVIAKTHSI
jgi:hypothetical protein